MTTITPKEPYASGINLLALCIWRESRGEVYDAKLGVGWVIRNRCEMSPAQGFKPTADEEILRKWQFSSFNSDDPNSDKYPEPGPTWDDCVQAALESSDPKNTVPPAAFYRAVFYYSHPLTAPPDAWGNVMETQTIGNLHFCGIWDTPEDVLKMQSATNHITNPDAPVVRVPLPACSPILIFSLFVSLATHPNTTGSRFGKAESESSQGSG